MKYFQFLIITLLFLLFSCNDSMVDDKEIPSNNPAVIGRLGNNQDFKVEAKYGLLLMGGGRDVDSAIQWMIDHANGGDILILRASGSDAYNEYLFDLANGSINSVKTLLIDSRELANNDEVIRDIKLAEAIFIAGGNQADYVNFWSNTKLSNELSELILNKKIVLGGTSAGSAILGEFIFDAIKGTVYSDEALNDPYIEYVSLQKNNLVDIDILQSMITDTHYNNPDRLGRHIAFMARLRKDFNTNVKGIGIQEETAVIIEDDGIAKVLGKGGAYFINAINPTLPEIVNPQQALTWGKDTKALKAVIIQDIENEYINLLNWDDYNSNFIQYISVNSGALKIENK